VAAIKKDNEIRIAFSGVCAYPFRSKEIEAYLKDNASGETLMNELLSFLPAPILSDIQGSAEYREYILKNTLQEVLERMGAR
jgi:CO/xanthine dehydrogenase FAD-binding subunit